MSVVTAEVFPLNGAALSKKYTFYLKIAKKNFHLCVNIPLPERYSKLTDDEVALPRVPKLSWLNLPKWRAQWLYLPIWLTGQHDLPYL